MILSDFIIINWLLLIINDLRLFFLLIHHALFVVDRLIVLYLIVILPCTLVVLDLFFCLFSVDVVLVFWVQYAFVLLAPILLIILVLLCVAVVVLFRVLLINDLLDVFLALFHLLVRIVGAHTCRLLVMLYVVVHLAEVLLRSQVFVLALILIWFVLLHLVLTSEIVSNCFTVVIILILHLQSVFLISFKAIIFDRLKVLI
jgi:hypothetical protein